MPWLTPAALPALGVGCVTGHAHGVDVTYGGAGDAALTAGYVKWQGHWSALAWLLGWRDTHQHLLLWPVQNAGGFDRLV